MPISPEQLPAPIPPAELLAGEVVDLRLIRVLWTDDADARPPAMRFLAGSTEVRFAIHRRSDGVRVGRIHLRLTDNPAIVQALGHCGFEIDEPCRGHGYAGHALRLVLRLAHHYCITPFWVLIEPGNTASRRTAERAGLRCVDMVSTAEEALALGLGPQVCRYARV